MGNKIPRLKDAVAPTAGSTHVSPVPLELKIQTGEYPAPLVITEAWVDCYGGMWFRGKDGTSLVLRQEHWETVSCLSRFASKQTYLKP